MNARIRRRWLDDGLEVARIGMPVDLTYPVTELGDDASVLTAIAAGDHPISRKLKRAKKPMLIIGAGACNRDDSKAISMQPALSRQNSALLMVHGTALTCCIQLLHVSAALIWALSRTAKAWIQKPC